MSCATRMFLAASLLGVAVGSGGCRELPNPESDEVARLLRTFDRIQRPGGDDMPVEKYFAWSARRDTGAAAPDESTEQLQGLVDAQRALVARIRKLSTTSQAGLSILEAYLAGHLDAWRAMERVASARRLGDAAGERAAEQQVRAALLKLRAALEHRNEIAKRLGVVLEPPRTIREAPGT